MPLTAPGHQQEQWWLQFRQVSFNIILVINDLGHLLFTKLCDSKCWRHITMVVTVLRKCRFFLAHYWKVLNSTKGLKKKKQLKTCKSPEKVQKEFRSPEKYISPVKNVIFSQIKKKWRFLETFNRNLDLMKISTKIDKIQGNGYFWKILRKLGIFPPNFFYRKIIFSKFKEIFI